MPVLRNAKHEAVAQSYFADPERIGWKAYQAHYPKADQHSAETAFSRLLLKNAEFGARIAELDQLAAAGKVMDLHEVLLELSHLGRSNLQDTLVNGDTTADVVASLRDMDRQQAAAIKTLTVDYYNEGSGDDAREVKRVRIELHDKRGALAELRRHFVPQKFADPDGKPLGTGAAEAAVDAVAEKLTDLELARRIAFALEKAARAPKEPAAPSAKKTRAAAKPKGKLKKRPSAAAE